MVALDRHLASIENLGTSFVRANLDWPQLEPVPPAGSHAYNYHVLDRWVGALAAHGLRWYAVGVGTPAWAADRQALALGCSIYSPPADPQDFAKAMAAVASRYGRDGTYWREYPAQNYRPVVEYEVWNEPNASASWCPGPDPVAYGELVEAASAAIHEVDPDAKVIMGGLAPFLESRSASGDTRAVQGFESFLVEAANATPGVREAIDVVGIHAYGDDPEAVARQVAGYRDATIAAGMPQVPLSLNETGWTTQGSGAFEPVPEAMRADYMREVTGAIASSNCGIASLSPHTWTTEETDPQNQEHWFGIASRESGRPYPTATAYGETIREYPPGSEVDPTNSICGD
ncbi:MAG: cellulase family glycosylhydrolase [Actinomycetota bacterium]|nr:cellulase family glycosylhydrolase [Actinomycetota bacterium]